VTPDKPRHHPDRRQKRTEDAKNAIVTRGSEIASRYRGGSNMNGSQERVRFAELQPPLRCDIFHSLDRIRHARVSIAWGVALFRRAIAVRRTCAFPARPAGPPRPASLLRHRPVRR
jgi:hypothetical protein